MISPSLWFLCSFASKEMVEGEHKKYYKKTIVKSSPLFDRNKVQLEQGSHESFINPQTVKFMIKLHYNPLQSPCRQLYHAKNITDLSRLGWGKLFPEAHVKFGKQFCFTQYWFKFSLVLNINSCRVEQFIKWQSCPYKQLIIVPGHNRRVGLMHALGELINIIYIHV